MLKATCSKEDLRTTYPEQIRIYSTLITTSYKAKAWKALSQLNLMGAFNQVAGILLGTFTAYEKVIF